MSQLQALDAQVAQAAPVLPGGAPALPGDAPVAVLPAVAPVFPGIAPVPGVAPVLPGAAAPSNMKPVTIKFDALPVIVNSANFKLWRDAAHAQSLSSGVADYLQHDIATLASNVLSANPALSQQAAMAFAVKQSSMVYGSLAVALGSHKAVVEQHLVDKYGSGASISHNAYLLWCTMTAEFANASTFNVSLWMSQLVALKHHADFAPRNTLEKLVLLEQQLASAGTVVPKAMLATHLLNALPPGMNAVKEAINASDTPLTVQYVYSAMERYWQQRQSSG